MNIMDKDKRNQIRLEAHVFLQHMESLTPEQRSERKYSLLSSELFAMYIMELTKDDE
jgi:hypothetical protein